MLKSTIFREYDIRGIADSELLSEDVEQLGRALGTYVIRNAGRRVNLGRDCRLSSERLRNALIEGLMASGCEVSDLGIVPTPVLYYSQFAASNDPRTTDSREAVKSAELPLDCKPHSAACALRADGAVMITGSHNPPEYNGFKTVAGGSAIHGDQIQAIRKLIESGDFESGSGSEKFYDAVTPYVGEIAGQFRYPRRVSVVFDAGNGTAGPVMRRLAKKLNINATELYFEMDGAFPNHHPDPTLVDNLEPLIDKVKETGAELGIAFDGDSDRIGAVDEKGNVIFGDMLMLIFGREILSRKPGATFIGEVKCSQIMYDELRKLGGNAIMYRTGHSLIKAKMKQEHAELAGEMSGHMFFADRYYGFDDALYSACRLIEIVANSGKPLSAQLDGIPQTVSTPEIRIDCPDEVKFTVVERVAEHFRKSHQVVDVDGVRVIFPHGWGLLRASNTQPVLVERFEAENKDLLKRYRDEVEGVLQQAKEVIGI